MENLAEVVVVPSVETAMDKIDDMATKPALTPPTSEDLDKRDDRMSSELSDLESDDDEEIEPDHYYDGGKIPVFKPVCYTPPPQDTVPHGKLAQRLDHMQMQRFCVN
jgi:hypothetical protein